MASVKWWWTVTVPQDSCEHMYHSTEDTVNVHQMLGIFIILGALPTVVQPPFLQLSTPTHTSQQIATFSVPWRIPTSPFHISNFNGLYLQHPSGLPTSPSPLHTKVVSLYPDYPHSIIHSTHKSQADLQKRELDHIILFLCLKFSK